MSKQRTITFEEAKGLFDTYKRDPINIDQTQQVYFKYDGLLEYLNSITKFVDPADVSKLGVKVYFGQYPENDTEPEKQGRRTIFFVPCIATEENGKIVNQDLWSVKTEAPDAYNHGDTCPPFDDVSPTGVPICSGSGF